MIDIKYNKILGIYKIINIVNNKIYIGSSVNLYNRIRSHFFYLKNNKHNNKYLQSSFNKYGMENFKVIILEEVNNKNELITREQFYLDNLKPFDHTIGYNILHIAASSLGHKFSEESKIKMSLSKIGKYKGENNWLFGKKNLSLTKLNKSRIGIKLKKETIEKLKKSKKNKIILQFDKNGKFVNKFISLNEAKRLTNIDSSSISECCNGIRNSAGGFAWKFFNEEENINLFGKEIEIKIKSKKKSINQYDLNMNLINSFISIQQAVIKTGYCWRLIDKMCKSKNKNYKGFIWKYS